MISELLKSGLRVVLPRDLEEKFGITKEDKKGGVEPVANQVRVRDFVRELPGAATEVSDAIANKVKDVGAGFKKEFWDKAPAVKFYNSQKEGRSIKESLKTAFEEFTPEEKAKIESEKPQTYQRAYQKYLDMGFSPEKADKRARQWKTPTENEHWKKKSETMVMGLTLGLEDVSKNAISKSVEQIASSAGDDIANATNKGLAIKNNINLNNINASEDIKNIISETAKKYVGQIDEARRGVITHTQTQEMADSLGMTVEKLIKRRAGKAFNAEELTAARELLTSSADDLYKLGQEVSKNNSDEALYKFAAAIKRHSAMQQEVSGATAEAGRALSALRIKATPEALKTQNYQAMLDALGGRDINEEIARRIAQIDSTDYLSVNKFIRGVSQAKTSDKVYEYWINSILSNPKTHLINTTGNTLTRLSKIPVRTGEATLDFLNHIITGKPRERFFGEVGSDIVGMTQGVKEGVRRALFVWNEGLPPEAVSKLETFQKAAIKGTGGEIVRTPGKFLTMEDEFFKAVNSQAELHAQAYRRAVQEGLKGSELTKRIAELIDDPLPEMLNAAKAYELYATFQQPLGKWGSTIMKLRDNMPGLRYVIPFLRTPMNIAKFGLEMTPLNFLRLGYLRSTGAIKGVQFTDELAKPVVGSLIAAATALYATEKKITGHAPVGQKERDAWYREGNQPYSIKIGSKWYSYQRLEPIGTVVGMVADFVQDHDLLNEGDRNKAIKAITASLTQNLKNKTYLSGLSNLMNAIEDPGRYGVNFAESITSGFVPQAMLVPTQAMDPYLRRPNGVVEAWKKKIPWLSKDVVPVRNVWGEAQQKEGGVLRRTISPIETTTVKEISPIDAELKKMGIEMGFPSKKVSGFALDDKHYDMYSATSGQILKKTLNQIIEMPSYQNLSLSKKEELINKTIRKVRDIIRDQYIFTLFASQMDIDIPAVIDQEDAAKLFYKLNEKSEFRELDNEKKRGVYVDILQKYLTR